MLEENTFILSSRLFRFVGEFSKLAELLNQGEVQKHPYLTTSYLCGQYVYYAATAAEDTAKPTTISKRFFKAELKFLREIGVEFDMVAALSYAEHFKKMLNNDHAKLIWF